MPDYEEYLSAFNKKNAPKSTVADDSYNYDSYLSAYNEVNPTTPQAAIEKTDTLENKYLQPLYNVGDKLKYLDKFRSATLGPIIQAATMGHPIETAKKEWTSWEPQPESSFSGALREQFPSQTPIMDTPAEDIKQGESTKAALKLFAKGEFPKAYNFASNIVPSDIPGLALDELSMNAVPSFSGSKAANKFEQFAELGREKALQRIAESRISSLPSDMAKEMSSKLKIKRVANTLDRVGLGKFLHDPEMIQKELNGERIPSYDKFGVETSVEKTPGMIEGLSKSLEEGAVHFSEIIPKVSSDTIVDHVVSTLEKEASPTTSLVPFDESIKMKLKDRVIKMLKIVPEEITYSSYTPKKSSLTDSVLKMLKIIPEEVTRFSSYSPKESPSFDFQNLLKVKRSAADFIYEIKNNPTTYGVEGLTDLKIHNAIWEFVDKYVRDQSSVDPNIKSFIQSNADLSDLLTARDIMANARSARIVAPSVGEVGIGIAGGAMLGPHLGISPALGASLGGGLAAARSMGRNLGESVTPRIANLQQAASDYVRPFPSINSLSRTLEVAAPITIPNAQKQVNMQRGLVEQLASYQIPRTVEGIISNPTLAKAKFAQNIKDPSELTALNSYIDNHTEKLGDMLPGLIQNYPLLFKSNKYLSWVNGKIVNPQERDIAYKKVQNSGYSNTEKAILMNGLNRDGSYPEGGL
jgi:hypothetical protein